MITTITMIEGCVTIDKSNAMAQIRLRGSEHIGPSRSTHRVRPITVQLERAMA
jgi:hypothetical protein